VTAARRISLLAAAAGALLHAVVLSAPARALVTIEEDFGNFPDAVEVGGAFGAFTGLGVNGDTITATGFLFTLRNTSYGDGFHSSFENDPDGDFATSDVLTPTAAAAIDAAQPFGIFSFTAHLPDELNTPALTALASGPAQFAFRTEDSDDAGFDEFIFEIDLSDPDGLLFDPTAPSGLIDPVFTNPETGTFSFFIAAPDGFDFSAIPQIRNSPGVDVSTEMAWHDGAGIETELLGERLRPRGEIQAGAAIPAPATALLFAAGLLGIGIVRRRRR